MKARTLRLLIASALILGLTACSPKQEEQTPTAGTIVGSIGGKPVTLEELTTKEVYQLQQQVHDRLQQQFKIKALEYLSEVDPEYKLPDHIDISDHEARDFYQQNGLAVRGSFEQMKNPIKQHLSMEGLRKTAQEILAKATKKGLIDFSLTPPAMPPAELQSAKVATGYVWPGSEGAKVMVLEFSDYHCPFCGRVQSTLENLRAKYKGKVAFGYRHFPLPFHQEADEAANAAECAREQGAFELMHSKLYDNQKIKDNLGWTKLAKESGVKDIKLFAQCLQMNKYQDLVNDDMIAGQAIGITGTPSFLIGLLQDGQVTGEVISGAMPEEHFVTTIEKMLAK